LRLRSIRRANGALDFFIGAFWSEVGFGLREENASEQATSVSVPIEPEQKSL
jgi:hypothetical protein